MGILLILKGRVRANWGRSEATHGVMKVGDEVLGGGQADTGTYDTPGRIVKRDARRIAMLMEVHTNSYPQGDLVSFDGRRQIVEKSGRRRDYRGNENSKGEGEASDGGVERLDQGILPRRVDYREPAESLREKKKAVGEQNVVGVLFVCKQGSWGGKVVERDAQKREICTGERREFLDESMVARLQQQKSGRRIRVGERLLQPGVGDGSGCPEASKDWDDDFLWRGGHRPSPGDGGRRERRAGTAKRETGP